MQILSLLFAYINKIKIKEIVGVMSDEIYVGVKIKGIVDGDTKVRTVAEYYDYTFKKWKCYMDDIVQISSGGGSIINIGSITQSGISSKFDAYSELDEDFPEKCCALFYLKIAVDKSNKWERIVILNNEKKDVTIIRYSFWNERIGLPIFRKKYKIYKKQDRYAFNDKFTYVKNVYSNRKFKK